MNAAKQPFSAPGRREATRRLLGRAIRYRGVIVAALLSSLIAGLAQAFPILLPKLFIDHVLAERPADEQLGGLDRWIVEQSQNLADSLGQGAADGRLQVAWLVAALIVAALVPDLRLRLTRVVEQGTQFAVTKLAASERYRDYNRLKLHPGAGKRIRAIQQRIPEGEPIIAWINAPFLLDYRRNPIIDVDNAGLNTPWARSPGVAHYVLWEYRGYGVRAPRAYAHQARRPGRQRRARARRGAAFMAFLRDQARRGKFLFHDGAMGVFRLPAPLRWP